MTYSVKMAERPAEALVGIKVTTDMARSATDCPRLWREVFGPRMPEVKFDGEMRSFGVSVVTDPKTGAFDYWAAMPLAKGAPTPDGMATLALPGGLYAECAVESLAALAGAYQYVYSEWAPSQKRYQLDMARPCYEYYPADYLRTQRFRLYFPVLEA